MRFVKASLVIAALSVWHVAPGMAQDADQASKTALAATAAFKVTAGSVCRIDPKFLPSGTVSPIVPVGPEGDAYLYITASKGVPTHDLQIGLVCTQKDGARQTAAAAIKAAAFRVPAQPETPASFHFDAKNTTGALSATKIDVTTASAQTLEKLGYPPRPDKGQAKAYELWQYMVTTPNVYQRPELDELPPKETLQSAKAMVLPALKANVAVPISYSPIWAGAFVQAAGKFTEVAATFPVPTLTPPATDLGELEAAEWDGINGGLNENALMQTGIDGTNMFVNLPFDSGVVYTATVYYGWYEYIPADSNEFGALSFSPGDTVTALVFLADTSTAPTANFQLCDLTRQKCSVATAKAPAGVNATLGSAEWIMERPANSGNQIWPLANFGNTIMTRAAFKTTVASETCVNGPFTPPPQYSSLYMTRTGTGTPPTLASGFSNLSQPPNTCMVDLHFFTYK